MAHVVDLSQSEDRDFSPIPGGTYHVMLTDYELRETGDEAKHPNNEYYNVEFTVQSGPFEGRRLWTNLMLPPYDPFMLKYLVAAADEDPNGSIDVEEFLEGAQSELELAVVVKVRKDPNGEYEPQNQIRRFKKLSEAKLSGDGASASGGLMP